MSFTDSKRSTGVEATQRFLPLLILLFVGSGCSALIYEIVWFQLLELVIGSSAISVGVLLGTFMGGMCVGSLLAPRLISKNHHPLRLYGFIEVGIGIIGLLILFGMPLVGGLYFFGAGHGFTGMLMRGVVAAICLLPPTFLMGATLPVISRWVKTSPEGVSWLGFFYGGNIGGAVIGSLLAGFYLMRVYDVATTTYVAVVLNLAVAALALLIAKLTPFTPEPDSSADTLIAADNSAWAVYVTIGLSGFTALSAEVIWTRLLSLLFGGTVYTFALILAAFLFGLGIGSTVGSALARSLKNPKVALGWCQMLLCGTMVWAAYSLMKSMPFWPVDVTLTTDPWLKVQLDMVRCLWAVLPAAILWGASFPLALASVATRGQDPGRLVGGVYAANTLGAIIGSLGASMVLVAWIGSQHSQQVLIAVSAISGLLMLALPSDEESTGKSNLNFAITVLCLAVAGGLLVMSVPELPGHFVAYGRFVPTRGANANIVYMGEGITASVAVSDMPDGTRNYHNAGKVQASSDPADMRLQRMLGHLTTLVPATNTDFLVIAFGAGVTAGAVSVEPNLKSETIVEIEPLVPKVVGKWFGAHNFEVAQNPKVHVEIDDGRHFLQTTKLKFDGITSDPLDPWVKGAAALYTREFFQLEKDHLKPGGVATQFVQFYESNSEAVKSEVATFFEVFPNGAIFANTVRGSGYDVVLVGQAEPIKIDIDKMQARLDSPEYAVLSKSLKDIGLFSAVDLLATYAGRPSDLQSWLKDAIITHDKDMRLQYLAGMSLNLYHANDIYQDMVKYGPYMPKEMFTGSDVHLQLLDRAISQGTSR
jgi:spermidine synthase